MYIWIGAMASWRFRPSVYTNIPETLDGLEMCIKPLAAILSTKICTLYFIIWYASHKSPTTKQVALSEKAKDHIRRCGRPQTYVHMWQSPVESFRKT